MKMIEGSGSQYSVHFSRGSVREVEQAFACVHKHGFLNNLKRVGKKSDFFLVVREQDFRQIFDTAVCSSVIRITFTFC